MKGSEHLDFDFEELLEQVEELIRKSRLASLRLSLTSLILPILRSFWKRLMMKKRECSFSEW
jgi:hypothetical protein